MEKDIKNWKQFKLLRDIYLCGDQKLNIEYHRREMIVWNNYLPFSWTFIHYTIIDW